MKTKIKIALLGLGLVGLKTSTMDITIKLI